MSVRTSTGSAIRGKVHDCNQITRRADRRSAQARDAHACGERHFRDALRVNYDVVASAQDLL
jgi:hypothetical protein